MAKKKATRARTTRPRSKSADTPDAAIERLEESLDVRMQEEDDAAPPPETPADGGARPARPAGRRRAAPAKTTRGRKKAVAPATDATPSPNAIVEKRDSGTVIRLPPVRPPRPVASTPAPPVETKTPPPTPPPMRAEPAARVVEPRREPPRGEQPRHDDHRRRQNQAPPAAHGEKPARPAHPHDRRPGHHGPPKPPAPRRFEPDVPAGGPPLDGRDPDAAPLAGDQTGEGGRRRRRRRRGGRGRGRGQGGPPDSRNPLNPGSAPVASPDLILRSQDSDPRPPVAGGEPMARPNLDGPSPSQKRRSRRRRRRGGGRGDEAGNFEAPIPRDERLPEPEMPVVPLDDINEIEEPEGLAAVPPLESPIHEPPFDDPEIEELNEARELLAGDDTEEDEAGSDVVEDREPDTEEPGQRRGRRGERRGPRGGPPRRRWRNQGESDEADSRVYGDENAEVVEIDPDAVGADEVAGPPPKKDMIINIAKGEECRIAILENGKLEQIYLERASSENHVGNIYKGVVTNVEASIQAAFIDFGLNKNGFLHISDLHPRYFPNGEDRSENIGRKLPRKARPPIQRCLRRGQEVLVQITKEGIGTKGPTLTTYLSVPGRFLVMMPGSGGLGVSRKIEDEDLRRKLRGLMNQLDLPEDIGFIARTAAESRSVRELQSDLNYLTRLWRAVEKRMQSERAPAEMYRDSDLVIRTIRDVYSTDVQRIVVDDPDVVQRAREFLGVFTPTGGEIVQLYQDPEPIFHRYGIEAELERLHSRHVPLRSGGSLVIDQTEALVAIDVNSGRFRAEDDAESTAYRINLEAADEIPRQLRLRDLGGVIICDFIDLRLEQHRREIEKRLIKNLKLHKERAKVLRMSQFGIIEMTRQRQRASLTRSVYQDCHHCRGSGLIKTAESVALDVMRLVQLAVAKEHIRAIEVGVSGEVAHLLQNKKRSAIYELEVRNRRSISIRPDPGYSLDQLQIQYYDIRGRLVPHP